MELEESDWGGLCLALAGGEVRVGEVDWTRMGLHDGVVLSHGSESGRKGWGKPYCHVF